MKKNKHILIAIILIPFIINAQQVLKLDSISSAIDKNYPEIQMYDLQIKALDSYAAGAKSWDAPQVGAGLYMTPYNFQKDMGSVMFSVQQMIPNSAKLRANRDYMQNMSSVEQQNRNYIKNQLLAKAKSDYYELVVLKKKKSVLKDNEQMLNFIISISEARYPYGKEKINNIYKAKASLSELNSMQIMIDNDILQKRISLNTILNRDKDLEFDVDTSYVIKDYENNTIDTNSLAKQRSDVRQIEESIKLTQLKQQVEFSKRKPDFGIRYDNMVPFGKQPYQFSIMGMMTIPIVPWSSKMYKANYEGLSFEIQSILKKRETALNEASGMIKSVQQKIKSKKQQVELYKDNIIPALQKNYKTTLLAYEQNTEELFVVLDAWQALKMSQFEYMNQLQELLLLQVEYEKENFINK